MKSHAFQSFNRVRRTAKGTNLARVEVPDISQDQLLLLKQRILCKNCNAASDRLVTGAISYKTKVRNIQFHEKKTDFKLAFSN